ncbi:branched-chain amino acid ABC transporter permease [Dactylosporangium sp. NPDC000244]|uniref:branched-chain amino acid ABC transporter permease n=1 Tax=Dactylosporangium sp. NPDC000244 TaxID=3154365 RepID=UPI003319146B
MRSLRALVSTPLNRANTLVVAVALVVAVTFPQFAAEPTIGVGFVALLYAMRNLTWNIAGGFTGLLSIAHASAFGIGAFSVAVLTWQHGINIWLAIGVGILLSAAIGAAVSLIMSRFGVNALFFTLGTLALAVAISGIAATWSVTGGVNGLQNLTTQEGILHLQWFTDAAPLYYVALAVLVLLTAGVSWMTRRTRFGRSLPFIREDPVLAASMGVAVIRNQAIAMGVSMGLTAIPGALIAQYTNFVSYDSVLSVEVGVAMLVGAIIGGSATLAGPIVAGIGIAVLEELLRMFAVSSSNVSSYTQIAYAICVIAILRFGGSGIVPLWNRLIVRLFGTGRPHDPESEKSSGRSAPDRAPAPEVVSEHA